MNIKSIVAPIIAVLAVAVQLILGVEIPDEVINNVTMSIVNLVAVILTVYGIFKSHTK